MSKFNSNIFSFVYWSGSPCFFHLIALKPIDKVLSWRLWWLGVKQRSLLATLRKIIEEIRDADGGAMIKILDIAVDFMAMPVVPVPCILESDFWLSREALIKWASLISNCFKSPEIHLHVSHICMNSRKQKGEIFGWFQQCSNRCPYRAYWSQQLRELCLRDWKCKSFWAGKLLWPSSVMLLAANGRDSFKQKLIQYSAPVWLNTGHKIILHPTNNNVLEGSKVKERILEICTPHPRWIPLHSMHHKITRFILHQVGSRSPQSVQASFPAIWNLKQSGKQKNSAPAFSTTSICHHPLDFERTVKL